MPKTKKETIVSAAKLAAVALGVSVALTIFGQAQYAVLGAIATMLAGTFTGYLGDFGIKKDSNKVMVGVITAALALGAFSQPNALSQAWMDGSNQLSGMFLGIGGATASVAGTGSTSTGGAGRIIATTATMTVTAETLTNKTMTAINPSGYRKAGESYISLSFSSGSASIASLDPTTVIDKLSVGTDGTYYWEQKESVDLNGDLSPTVNFRLVPVATSDTITLYDSALNDITNTTATDTIRTNTVTVGSGGSLSFVVRPEVTSTATGIRSPVLGFEYNTSAWDTVDMGGLATVDCPSRLVTAAAERSLAKCYDLGSTWLLDSGSKAGIAGAQYGYKDFSGKANAVSGIDPRNITGNCIKVYVLDKDQYFKSSAGSLYFLDPEKGTTDLGKTTETAAAMCAL